MTEYVVDASVAVEYLLKTPLGLRVADVIEDSALTAPELMDAEVLSVLRRAVQSGQLDDVRALMAIEDLVDWPVKRISHGDLVRLAWEHRHNLSAYDALYVAAARAHDVPLLTADGRFRRAFGIGIVVQNIRMA